MAPFTHVHKRALDLLPLLAQINSKTAVKLEPVSADEEPEPEGSSRASGAARRWACSPRTRDAAQQRTKACSPNDGKAISSKHVASQRRCGWCRPLLAPGRMLWSPHVKVHGAEVQKQRSTSTLPVTSTHVLAATHALVCVKPI